MFCLTQNQLVQNMRIRTRPLGNLLLTPVQKTVETLKLLNRF